MSSGCSKLKVTQVGGFAGNIALPPLVELDRAALDSEGQAALDDACRQLTDAAAGATASAARLGADLPRYRVEVTDADGATRSFLLQSAGSSALAAEVDVPQVLASLQRAIAGQN